MCQGPKGYIAQIFWSTPAVWKQYNKMAVLHFFLVNSPLIYILFSLGVVKACWLDGGVGLGFLYNLGILYGRPIYMNQAEIV